MPGQVHVVVIKTAGNQRYIFDSTRRRENVGASHLITRVERDWLDAALGGRGSGRIETDAVEVVTANAGGVTLLVREPDEGRRIIGEITRRALREAPGLDVCGVVGDPFEWGGAKAADAAFAVAREELMHVRTRRPGPEARFPGVPVAERCVSSGLPAERTWRVPGEGAVEPCSAPSRGKLDAYDRAIANLVRDIGVERDELKELVQRLNDDVEWVALVHADGNGMGRVFAGLGAQHEDDSARVYVDALHDFSEAVDECTRAAFRAAVPDGPATILPLVLGGDDLTVVCEGPHALPFAVRYLEEFARRTRDHPHIRREVDTGLGACAGVAITKRAYPFHNAIDLVEELTAEAKKVKKPLGADACALSFHVLYESAVADLDRLRAAATRDGARLTAQPYVVRGDGDWAHGRRWSDLQHRVNVLTERNKDGNLCVSRSRAHELRTGLFLGPAVAEKRFAAIDPSPDLGRDGALFWEDADGELVTGLLDAMNATAFLAGEAAR
ncbi:Cas10/Cmr2 second palm domain-containing protein [Actinomadura atramentaria]|uniref:Cas10/Cmr2 second palm domain-containing protein n=1 Tax=Actinomadura atramentaria TaxID=1990 RepID=UPI0003A21021|nr:hypothetical protein [Actinomadura atramentaria]